MNVSNFREILISKCYLAIFCCLHRDWFKFSEMPPPPPPQYFVLMIMMGKRDNILLSISSYHEKVVMIMVHLLFTKSTAEPPLVCEPPLWLPSIYGWYTFIFLVMLAFLLQDDNISYVTATQYLTHLIDFLFYSICFSCLSVQLFNCNTILNSLADLFIHSCFSCLSVNA